jgi:aldehyde:ferredoxin oxidoreductase
MNRRDDQLPKRFEEALEEGGSRGESYPKKELERLLDEYYKIRGWTPDGIPTSEILKRLGLNWSWMVF